MRPYDEAPQVSNDLKKMWWCCDRMEEEEDGGLVKEGTALCQDLLKSAISCLHAQRQHQYRSIGRDIARRLLAGVDIPSSNTERSFNPLHQAGAESEGWIGSFATLQRPWRRKFRPLPQTSPSISIRPPLQTTTKHHRQQTNDGERASTSAIMNSFTRDEFWFVVIYLWAAMAMSLAIVKWAPRERGRFYAREEEDGLIYKWWVPDPTTWEAQKKRFWLRTALEKYDSDTSHRHAPPSKQWRGGAEGQRRRVCWGMGC